MNFRRQAGGCGNGADRCNVTGGMQLDAFHARCQGMWCGATLTLPAWLD
jgi:hypothetical protein